MTSAHKAWERRIKAAGGPKAEAFRLKERVARRRQRAAKAAREGRPVVGGNWTDRVQVERESMPTPFEPRVCRVIR